MSTPPGWPPSDGGQHHQPPPQPPFAPGTYPLPYPQAYPPPYPGPGSYPAHGYPYPYPQPFPAPGPGLNAMALTSLIVGGMGVLMMFTIPITSVLAVVFGHRALGQITRTGETGRPLAVIGLWIGYVSLTLLVAGIVVAIVIVATT